MKLVTPDSKNEPSSLFQLTAPFTMHGGGTSYWKIECDHLSDGDIEWFAKAITNACSPFGAVVGIPRGGLRLAEALQGSCLTGHRTLLIVDDVFTTGTSMVEYCEKYKDQYENIIGAVMFNRSGMDFTNITSIIKVDPKVLDKLP